MKKVLVCMIIIFIALAGCIPKNGNQPGPSETNKTSENRAVKNTAELAKLLPDEAGFDWYYSGFAEYGHRMTLTSISKNSNNYEYNIDGLVDDPSGGEAKDRDFSLQIKYTLKDGIFSQSKTESTMLDSDFDLIEIIRTPLKEGTNWTQNVKRENGQNAVLECKIDSIIKSEGVNIYTVSYQERDSDYYEKRMIKEGVGIISFEKLLTTQSESFPVTYSLNAIALGSQNKGLLPVR